jgi:hypothetical protein
MKAYLVVTGILFAVFAVFHFFIAWSHFQQAGLLSQGIPPALIGLVAAAIAAWGFRLARSAAGSAS